MSARAFAAALAVILPCLAHADPLPTATEVFHLRTECAKLAKERFEADFVSPNAVGASVRYRANYNTKTGRCYYELTVNWPGKDAREVSSLYDIHGGTETIAHANTKTGSSGWVSFVTKDGHANMGVSYQEARDYIDAIMGPAE